jgi:hypothetical protein
MKTLESYLLRKYEDQKTVIQQQEKLIKSMESQNKQLTEKFECLKKKSIDFKNGRVRGLDYFDLSLPAQFKIRKKSESINATLMNYLATYNLMIPEINVCKAVQPNVCRINIVKTNLETKADAIITLYMKDKLHLSDDNYKDLRRTIAHDWPSFYEINKARQGINLEIEKRLKHNSRGVNMSVRDRMEEKLTEFLKSTKKVNIGQITIKFSADSTNIGQKLKVLNAAFSIVNDTANCKTKYGHYIIGKLLIYFIFLFNRQV